MSGTVRIVEVRAFMDQAILEAPAAITRGRVAVIS